jgi:hypothetical protein
VLYQLGNRLSGRPLVQLLEFEDTVSEDSFYFLIISYTVNKTPRHYPASESYRAALRSNATLLSLLPPVPSPSAPSPGPSSAFPFPYDGSLLSVHKLPVTYIADQIGVQPLDFGEESFRKGCWPSLGGTADGENASLALSCFSSEFLIR